MSRRRRTRRGYRKHERVAIRAAARAEHAIRSRSAVLRKNFGPPLTAWLNDHVRIREYLKYGVRIDWDVEDN